MDEKNIEGIIAGLEEHMINGEVILANGKQVVRVMRLYELKFYAYPDTTDGIMDLEYKGNMLGAPVNIQIRPLASTVRDEK